MIKLKKYIEILLICFLIGVSGACGGGGSSVKKTPEHLTAGIREIKKGTVWYNQGCYTRSMDYFVKALELFSASDQLEGVAMSMNNIGNVYRATGDIDTALLFYEEAFTVYSGMNDSRGAMQALSNKAAALIDAGRLDDAGNALDKAEQISAGTGISFIPLLSNRGILLTKQKKYDQARETLLKALGDGASATSLESASVYFALGNLMLETGTYDSALAYFNKALDADRKTGFYKGMADELASIGSAYLGLEKYDNAAACFKRSIKIYALTGNREKVNLLMKELENASEASGTDITLTKRFVDKWLEGHILAGPCD